MFIPLSTVAFQTLDPKLRTEATGLFNLVRNIGSSIGISIMAALLTSNMQINHADLAAQISPFNPNLHALGIDPATLMTAGRRTDGGPAQRPDHAAGADDRLSRRLQADVLITLCAAPLLLLLRYKPMTHGAGRGRRRRRSRQRPWRIKRITDRRIIAQALGARVSACAR